MEAVWSVNGAGVEAIPALKLITPAAPIVSWGEAAAHLRLDAETQRTLIESYVATATQHFTGKDGVLGGRALGPETYELYLDAFPCGPILLPITPLIAVVSVGYVDTAGLPQTVDPINYVIDDKSRDAWIVPIAGYAWPATLAAINVVTVRFTAGFVPMPEPLKHAVLVLAAHFNENREATSPVTLNEIPIGVYDIAGPYRRMNV